MIQSKTRAALPRDGPGLDNRFYPDTCYSDLMYPIKDGVSIEYNCTSFCKRRAVNNLTMYWRIQAIGQMPVMAMNNQYRNKTLADPVVYF